ncbi:unnamed protein product [Brugia pahangi]|uniref:Secreted protein n=1 Tax=Brugia pahangi TaxID=6280 RepID=A0A0N4T802_BRUPA|nr:unnamed protein product [Brugia pahangi]
MGVNKWLQVVADVSKWLQIIVGGDRCQQVVAGGIASGRRLQQVVTGSAKFKRWQVAPNSSSSKTTAGGNK